MLPYSLLICLGPSAILGALLARIGLKDYSRLRQMLERNEQELHSPDRSITSILAPAVSRPQ
jgi:hypothetical protein